MANTDLNLRIEFARRADATTIARVSRREIEYGLTWRYTSERISRAIADRRTNVIVARVGSEMVGFAIMRYAETNANLDLLGVLPAWRNRGIGERLVAWLTSVADAAGIATILVQVREQNSGAIRFYHRLAFRLVKKLPGYYGKQESAQLLARRLRTPS